MDIQGKSLTDELREVVEALLGGADHSLAIGDLAAARRDYERASRCASGQRFDDLAERAVDGLRAVACREELLVAASARGGGRWSDAETSYLKAGELIGPKDVQAAHEFGQGMLALGQHAEREGRLPDALKHYDALLQRLPAHPQASADQARVHAMLQEEKRRRILKLVMLILMPLLAVVLGVAIWRVVADIQARVPGPVAGTPIAEAGSRTPTLVSTAPSRVAGVVTISAHTPPASPTLRSPASSQASAAGAASGTPTFTPFTSTAAPAPTHTPTVTAAPTIELVFRGFVRRTTGEALGDFESVQLWGTTDLGSGQSNLDAVFTMPDGSFVLKTTAVFPYYLLWLQPANAQLYRPMEAIPGPGGNLVSPQMIRYANPTDGVHGDNVFRVAVSTPTLVPTSTLVPTRTPVPTAVVVATLTSTPQPKLPTVRLMSPAPDSTVKDLVDFHWELSSPLPDGVYAEVVMWREGWRPSEALGVAAVVRDTQLSVHLAVLPWTSDGAYYWTVVLVRVEPYQRLTQLSTGRRIFVQREGGDSGPVCPPGGC